MIPVLFNINSPSSISYVATYHSGILSIILLPKAWPQVTVAAVIAVGICIGFVSTILLYHFLKLLLISLPFFCVLLQRFLNQSRSQSVMAWFDHSDWSGGGWYIALVTVFSELLSLTLRHLSTQRPFEVFLITAIILAIKDFGLKAPCCRPFSPWRWWYLQFAFPVSLVYFAWPRDYNQNQGKVKPKNQPLNNYKMFAMLILYNCDCKLDMILSHNEEELILQNCNIRNHNSVDQIHYLIISTPQFL